MRAITNQRLVKRRRRQAAILSLGGMAVLGVGLAVNLLGLGEGAERESVYVAYGALLLGSVLSWIGIALSDRWTLPPRADQALEAGLKGAGRAYSLYNWTLPADHVLLSPWGLTVFTVLNSDGPVDVNGKRWRDGRPLWRRILSFGRRPVREPSRLLGLETRVLSEALLEADTDDEFADVQIEGVAVFSRPGIALSVEAPSVPALRADELREWLREKSKAPNLTPARRRRLERALDAVADARLGS